MISTRIHGAIDYAVAGVLLAAPFLFGFADGGPAQWATMTMGGIALLYSLFTRYELGLIRLLPMRGHLMIDLAFAPVLIGLPFLWRFSGQVWLPHVVLGAAGLLVTALTAASLRREPSEARA